MTWRNFPDELPDDWQVVHITDGEVVVTAKFDRERFFIAMERGWDVGMYFEGVGFGGYEWDWDFDTVTHWCPLIKLPGEI